MVKMDSLSYLKNNKRYKVETLGDVIGVTQALKKCQVDVSAFIWLPWQPLNRLVLFGIHWRNSTKNNQFSNVSRIYSFQS